MSNHHEEPIELQGVPAEEGVSGEDAVEQLAESPEEKRNFTDTHSEEDRLERQGGEDEPDG